MSRRFLFGEVLEIPFSGEISIYYIDKALFTSGSTVKAFVDKFDELPANVQFEIGN